jgi:hypothetical protein
MSYSTVILGKLRMYMYPVRIRRIKREFNNRNVSVVVRDLNESHKMGV